MPVTDVDEARLVQRLRHDVAATIGAGYEDLIQYAAAHLRTFRDDPDDYIDKVVEDVQQEFHDLFIDTTWPACPFHPHHPLWLHNEQWMCEQTQTPVAPLGGLRTRGELPDR